MFLELVGDVLPGLAVRRRLLLGRDIGPDFREIRVEFQELLQRRLGIGLDRVDRAFRLADPAINAFVGMDDEHVVALVEAIHGAHLDAVHELALDATFDDDVSHS